MKYRLKKNEHGIWVAYRGSHHSYNGFDWNDAMRWIINWLDFDKLEYMKQIFYGYGNLPL